MGGRDHRGAEAHAEPRARPHARHHLLVRAVGAQHRPPHGRDHHAGWREGASSVAAPEHRTPPRRCPLIAEATAPVAARASGPPAPRLRLLGLVFVLYFTVSGGAFTLETLVATVGPVIALSALIVIPVFWAIPEALLIGELASMLPVEGGYYRWVQRAFGDGWGFQNAWCTWLYSLVEMSLYPAIVIQYLGAFAPGLTRGWIVLVTLVVIWVPTLLNLRGAVPVGRVSVLIGILVLACFGLLALFALPRITHAPWATLGPTEPVRWSSLGTGLSLALWNWIGWDNASTVCGEIEDAERTYPRALALAVPLVALGYLVPLLPALAADDWRTWREGGWPDIARAVAGPAGPPLAVAIIVLAMLSATAMFNSLLLAYSRIPLIVARDGLLPRWLAVTDTRGVPRRSILLASTLYSGIALLPFSELISADVLLYAVALALEFAALIRLRRTEPTLRGSFRLPIGRGGLVLLALCPMVILVGVSALELQAGEFGGRALLVAAATAAAGPLVFTALARRRERGRATSAAPPSRG
ncbi:MAG: APC family permease [Gemmatimonadaceae bacterium]|nr:APC family permease [Gemmatimonadaceae bacterium]